MLNDCHEQRKQSIISAPTEAITHQVRLSVTKYSAAEYAIGVILMASATLLLSSARLDATSGGVIFGSKCLSSSDSGPVPPNKCEDDPLNLSDNVDIDAVLAGLNIEKETIRLRGCARREFATSERRPRGQEKIYLVEYPLDHDIAPDAFVGPLIHELSHVVQLRIFGGMAQLKSALDSTRIELGADFISGILYRRYVENAGIGSFQLSLSLSGNYIMCDDDHGRPEDRISAFRHGYYFNDYNGEIEQAHIEFQRDIFGSIRSW